MTHILSFLGTANYEKTTYYDGGNEREYFVLALLDCIVNKTAIWEEKSIADKELKLTVFLTKEARIKNWEQNPEDTEKIKLKQQLDSYVAILPGNFNMQINTVDIKDGNTESDIWENFNIIYDAIGNNEDIVFDITNGFRALPFITSGILSYSAAMKQCSIDGIYYGVYIKNTPGDIADLTSFYRMLEFTDAAKTFLNYGYVKPLDTLFNQEKGGFTNEDKKKWNKVSKLISTMSIMDASISTCRGTYDLKNNDTIINKYNAIKDINIDDLWADKDEEQPSIRPVKELSKKIQEEYVDSFSSAADDIAFGVQVAKWCYKHELYQQGYTSLLENLISFMVKVVGEADISKQYRGYISSLLQLKKSYSRNESEVSFEEYIKNEYICKEKDKENELKRVCGCNRKILETLPEEKYISIARIYGELDDLRNDINHFGKRKDMKSAKDLINKLGELINKVSDFIIENKME